MAMDDLNYMKIDDLDEGVDWQKEFLDSMMVGTVLGNGKGKKQRLKQEEGGWNTWSVIRAWAMSISIL